ncbi:MAG: glycosyltransferase family 9 protein [Solirubrobacteraceae bacterium]
MIYPSWSQARRLLAVRLDNLGDVLVTTPAIRAIKAALPDIEIALLASPVGAQAGRLNRDISEVIEYEAPWVDPWQTISHDAERELALIERLRAGRFDAAVIFTSFRQSPLPAAYLCYLAGIPLRLGATMDAAGSLLTTRLKRPESLAHEVERALDLVGAVGIPPAESRLVLDLPADARVQASRLRTDLMGTSESNARPLVVVHPGCSMPARAYSADRYVEAIDALVRELGATVALTGTESERALTAAIWGDLDAGSRVHVRNLAGALAFADFCALIEAADLAVTNNTGPMHVAAAVATPLVALFAMTNPPEQWSPWKVPHRILNHDVPCRICYSRVCPYNQECLSVVTAREIVAAARDLIIGAGRVVDLQWAPALERAVANGD